MKRNAGKTVRAKRRARVQRRPSGKPPAVVCNAVFLVGFMGAGKSSVGRALGQRLHWAFEDLDDRIELREGRSVAAIFRDSGEAEFRRMEHSALRSVLEELSGGATRIVALGGGAFVQENNAALLRGSKIPTVFLEAPVEELWRRCSEQAREAGTERPLRGSLDQFRRLYEARCNSYANAAFRIQTGHRNVETIAAEIEEMLGLQKIVIRTEQGEVE